MKKNRFEACFGKCHKKGKIAFIPFFVLGYPDDKICIDDIRDAIHSGADALELGIPFSDPIADGEVIQQAAADALRSGATVTDCFEIIQVIREEFDSIPIGLLVYANLVENMGIDKFYSLARSRGVDAILIADVPLCESEPYENAAKREGLDHIFMVTPSCSEGTLKQVASKATGYVYVVGRQGVTGAEREANFAKLSTQIAFLDGIGATAKVIGFGISQPEHIVAAKAAGAKGVIVGSHLVANRSQIKSIVQDLQEKC